MRRRSPLAIPWALAVLFLFVSFGSAFAQPKPKTREVTGAVVDADQKPVANATVTVGDGGPTATTAADGTFKLTGVATTNVVVEFKADGLSARTIPLLGAATALSLQVVLVKPQGPPPAATRSVAGVVTDGKRQPIAGARVVVRGTQLTATTAADGTFAIAGRRAGRRHARRRGGEPARRGVFGRRRQGCGRDRRGPARAGRRAGTAGADDAHRDRSRDRSRHEGAGRRRADPRARERRGVLHRGRR